ncbi:hypothetical protein ALO_16402 [Acetonema longum DSM 6540]|uniref:MORN repeat-containing protein n=1 Tax=Acetonema longum DSM 6540 TaxID=1009370 RepID=F7NMF0_9FIRM|nr:hypothetical protein ALO_16402 [Acetonema longum DSM 6540]
MREGKLHGYGMQQFYTPSGMKLGKYEGHMNYGFRQGFGILGWGGYEYAGEWKESLYHGQGIERTAANAYKGEFRNGEKNGYGILLGDGTVHTGTFIDGKLINASELKEGYFIIGLCSKSYDEAAAEADKSRALGFTPAVSYSSQWSNLTPGYYMVVYGVLPTMEDIQFLDNFKVHGNISYYIKYSGKQLGKTIGQEVNQVIKHG